MAVHSVNASFIEHVFVVDLLLPSTSIVRAALRLLSFSSLMCVSKILGHVRRQISGVKSDQQASIWLEKTSANGYRADQRFSPGRVLISPIASQAGADVYRFMREVKRGDVVLHFIDNEAIIAISFVRSECRVITRMFSENYLVELLGYTPLSVTFDRQMMFCKPLVTRYLALQESGVKHLFYGSKLKIRQGAYLTPVNHHLMNLLDEAYQLATNGGSLSDEVAAARSRLSTAEPVNSSAI